MPKCTKSEEIRELKAALREIYEVWAGSGPFEASTVD